MGHRETISRLTRDGRPAGRPMSPLTCDDGSEGWGRGIRACAPRHKLSSLAAFPGPEWSARPGCHVPGEGWSPADSEFREEARGGPAAERDDRRRTSPRAARTGARPRRAGPGDDVEQTVRWRRPGAVEGGPGRLQGTGAHPTDRRPAFRHHGRRPAGGWPIDRLAGARQLDEPGVVDSVGADHGRGHHNLASPDHHHDDASRRRDGAFDSNRVERRHRSGHVVLGGPARWVRQPHTPLRHRGERGERHRRCLGDAA